VGVCEPVCDCVCDVVCDGDGEQTFLKAKTAAPR